MQWSPIGLGDANRFTTVETSQAEYNASVGEFVKSTGQEVVLPEPTENGIVVVRNVGPQLRVSAASGLVHTDSGFRRLESKEPVYLVSDGTNWYSLSGTDGFLPAIPKSVTSRPQDNDSFTDDIDAGFQIHLKNDWPSIGVRISNKTTGVTRAYLYEDDNDGAGLLIEDIDISGKSSGDTFVFDDVDLENGEKYWIAVDAEGSDWERGYAEGEDDYPYVGDDLDITDRYLDGGANTGTVAALNDIGNPDGVLTD